MECLLIFMLFLSTFKEHLYFISFYDYYQPEAYVPQSDTYIEKDASINDEIDELRNAATASLIRYNDTIVVASVSCIYGIGDKDDYEKSMLILSVGDKLKRNEIISRLIDMTFDNQEHEEHIEEQGEEQDFIVGHLEPVEML